MTGTHGGSRPGSGRRRKTDTNVEVEPSLPPQGKELTPLEYMLAIVNDPKASAERRDRMAQIAAQYMHAKSAEPPKGKREEQKDAAERAGGKFAVPSGPKLVVNNK